MLSPWDASSITTAIDVAKAIALVMTGGTPTQLAQYWYQNGYAVSQLQMWSRSGTRPAAFYVRSGTSAVFAVCGIDSAQQAAALVGSLSVPMVKVGSWQANSIGVADAISLQGLLRSTDTSNVSNLLVSGYSYGGCLAAILAALQLGESGSPAMQLLTFGSPRPGAASLSGYLRQLMSVRYFNDNDAVTHFPPHLDEAPALYAVLPFVVAIVAQQHVHVAGGVQLDAAGNATMAQASALYTPTAEVDLALWITSVLASQANGHSLVTYLDRMSKLRSNMSASGNALPTGAGAENSATLVVSQPVNGPLASGAVVPLAQMEEGKSVVYFQPVLRPKVIRVVHKWHVYWLGFQIAQCDTQSTAKTIAKYMYKFLREWHAASAVSQQSVLGGFAQFLSQAGEPVNGTRPPFNIIP